MVKWWSNRNYVLALRAVWAVRKCNERDQHDQRCQTAKTILHGLRSLILKFRQLYPSLRSPRYGPRLRKPSTWQEVRAQHDSTGHIRVADRLASATERKVQELA